MGKNARLEYLLEQENDDFHTIKRATEGGPFFTLATILFLLQVYSGAKALLPEG